MSSISLLLVAIFLPLFPFSMVFNRLFARIASAPMRIALLLAWPSIGLVLLSALGNTLPTWVAYWSVATALLYAFRALALRDLALWLSHIATSAWALLWLPAVFDETARASAWPVAAFSVPLVLLAWLTGYLERTYGAAYAGSLGGLATGAPRLAGLLVFTVLAAIGTPLFPGFFVLLNMIGVSLNTTPATALAVLAVWMLWAWAGVRILQGLIVGPPNDTAQADIGPTQTGILGMVMAAFAAGGIWLSGGLA